MIKVALFDIDGLVVVGRNRLFSERLASEYHVAKESIMEFFEKDFRKCSFGQADLKEVIAPYLERWGWKEGVDMFLKYWFESEQVLDSEVLKIIERLRSGGIRCYIATRQEKYRLTYLVDHLGLRKYFDGVFATCNIGYDKYQKEFFDYVEKELNLKPQEILFFDDSKKNIEKANDFGIDARFYEGIETLKSFHASI